MPGLFDPITIGRLTLPNRIIMAPLTRGRASQDHVPSEMMAVYYAQRASAGLIISEATGISRQGLGWPFAPGLWTAAQIEAWKPVTDAVHKADGRIFAQLWHMGRLVHSSFIDGAMPVSASATAAPGKAHTYIGRQEHEVARPLPIAEIPGVIADYVAAARSAISAGFDGVQIHGANGYLIDQFLRDSSNLRDDEYGGAPENRIRLLREVTSAVIAEVGAERTAVRLSPNGETQGVNDSQPESVFIPAAAALNALGIAFLELREPGPNGTFGRSDHPRLSPAIRQVFHRPLVLNSDYDADRAEADIQSGLADAVSFGRTFLANPDLPHRFAEGLPLNPDVPVTWYSQGPTGYIDYPYADAADAAAEPLASA